MRNNHITLLSSIIISMATHAFAEEAEDIDIHNLYSFQAELESKLNGTPEENWRYAALLPLKAEFDDGYQYDILKVIDEYNLQEAIPMLESSLTRNRDYWGYGKGYAVYVWFRLKTDGMNEEEKAEFIASTYKLGTKLDIYHTAGPMLRKMGPLGRKHLMAALRKIKGTFTCDNDRIMAFSLYHFEFTPEEAEEFANSDSYFLMYLAQNQYRKNNDTKAIELGLEMMDTKKMVRYLPKYMVCYDIYNIKGWQNNVVHLLKIFKHNPNINNIEHEIRMTLYNVEFSLKHYTTSAYSSGLIRELEYIANRDSLPLPKEHESKKLQYYIQRLDTNEFASSLLKQIRERQKK